MVLGPRINVCSYTSTWMPMTMDQLNQWWDFPLPPKPEKDAPSKDQSLYTSTNKLRDAPQTSLVTAP